jgi:hypothetical protein
MRRLIAGCGRDFDRGGWATDMSTSNARAGLLALTVAFSAGIHAALVPEHLREMPPLGYLFLLAAAIGAAVALALVARPNDVRILRLAVLFLSAQIVAWAMFIVVHVPGFAETPEPVEPIALVCKAAELLGIALALPLAVGASLLGRRSPSPWRTGGPEHRAEARQAGRFRSPSCPERQQDHVQGDRAEGYPAHVHVSGAPLDAGDAGRQVGQG